MWVIGQASKKEIEQMKKQGWDVKLVEESHFNKALNTTYKPEQDADLNEHDGDKLVAVYTDNDISKQLRHYTEQSYDKMVQKEKLHKVRREKLENLYGEMKIPEDQPVTDTLGIVTDDNHYIQTFLYESLISTEPRIKGTFHVKFEEGTDKVIESYPGEDVPISVE